MEIVLKVKKTKPVITRRSNGDGVLKIDKEACDILEEILGGLESYIPARTLASELIKAAAKKATFKVEEE
jgi:DNA modification methylase